MCPLCCLHELKAKISTEFPVCDSLDRIPATSCLTPQPKNWKWLLRLRYQACPCHSHSGLLTVAINNQDWLDGRPMKELHLHAHHLILTIAAWITTYGIGSSLDLVPIPTVCP